MINRSLQVSIVIASSILILIGTDILLPSLPHITSFFAVPDGEVKMLISIFMLGQFVAVLFWGIVADQIGKRLTLKLGMLIFLLGSLLSLKALTIEFLLFCRFIQGVGGVVVPVAGWSLVQDLFPKDESARIMSWIGMLVAVVPLFAPALGGKLDVLFGWQANLYCITAYALFLSFIMMCIPIKRERSIDANKTVPARFSNLARIARNRTFVSYIAFFGLLNCGEWCFLTVAPFYYDSLHIAADAMGILLMITSIGFVFGSLMASKLMNSLGIDKIILLAIQLALVSSLFLLMAEYLDWSNHHILIALIMGLYMFASAFLWGGSTSRALQCFDDCRGSASAVRSLIMLCFAAFGTLAGRIIDHNSLYPVGIFLLIMTLTALWLFHRLQLIVAPVSSDTEISA